MIEEIRQSTSLWEEMKQSELSSALRRSSDHFRSKLLLQRAPQLKTIALVASSISTEIAQSIPQTEASEAERIVMGIGALFENGPITTPEQKAQAAATLHKLVRYTLLALEPEATEEQKKTMFEIIRNLSTAQLRSNNKEMRVWWAGFRNELAFVHNLTQAGWKIFLPDQISPDPKLNTALQFDIMQDIDCVGVRPDGAIILFSYQKARSNLPEVVFNAVVDLTGQNSPVVKKTLEEVAEKTASSSTSSNISRRKIVLLRIRPATHKDSMEIPLYQEKDPQRYLSMIGQFTPDAGFELLRIINDFTDRRIRFTREY